MIKLEGMWLILMETSLKERVDLCNQSPISNGPNNWTVNYYKTWKDYNKKNYNPFKLTK